MSCLILTSRMWTNVLVCACAMALKFTPGAILVWVVTMESYVLGGGLGRYIQGGVTFKGAL